MRRPLFSVIIPAYNVEKYLHQCVDSVLKQDFDDYEIIIVDDGSSDRTPQICDEYTSDSGKVVVIHKANGGESAARYDAVKVATGSYICCIDADDWIDNGLFKSAARKIGKYHPDVVIYGFKTEDLRGNVKSGTSCRAGYYTKEQLEKEIYPWLIQSEDVRYFHPSVWGGFFKKDLIENNMINNKHAVFGEDQAVSIPCFANAQSMYSMQGCYYNYRYNDQSVTKSKRVYDWECPKAINRFIMSRIDVSQYNFREQIERKIVHDFWTTAVSRFNGDQSYEQVRDDIIRHMDMKLYRNAIAGARFRGSKRADFMMAVLRHRWIWIMCVFAKMKK